MFAPVASSPVRSSSSSDGSGLQQGDAATGDDALFDGSLGAADGVFDAVLALLELDLGGGADLDHRNAAGQLGQALLQLLAVVVGVAVLDLGADLVDAPGDRSASPAPSTMVVSSLVTTTVGLAEQLDVGGLELDSRRLR